MNVAAAIDPRDPVELALDRLLLLFLLGAGLSIAVEQGTAFLVCLIWVVDTLRRRRRPYLPLLWPVLAFYASAALSTVAALDRGRAAEQLWSEWGPLLFFLVVANLPPGTRSATWRVNAMTLTGALAVVPGFFQTWHHGSSFRISGVLGGYVTYSEVLVLLGLPLVASLLFREGGLRRRPSNGEIVRVAVLFAMAAALSLTQTRGAWLAAFAGTAVLVALWRARWLVALPVVAVLAFAVAPPAARARVVDLFDLADITATERVYMWRSSLSILADHPLTGVGPECFGYVIEDYRRPDDTWIEGRPLDHAHSNVLNLAAERGWPGVVTWIVLWFAWLVTMWRIWRGLPPGDRGARGAVAGSIAAVVAFHVAGLTEYTWGDTEMVFLMAFFLGAGLAYGRKRGAHLEWGRGQ